MSETAPVVQQPQLLSVASLSPAQLAALVAERSPRLLGLACIGTGSVPGADGLPLQRIVAPLLGAGAGLTGEAWHSAMTCIAGEGLGIRFRADANVLYGVVEVDESAYRPQGDASPLQRATEDVYRRIFRLLDAEGFPELWRVWNYLAEINAETPAGVAGGGLERYRQFNVGRQDAFLASGRLTGGKVPAACALGVRGGPLSIAFLAGREPALPLENPRQVSAWNYPPDYGPRAPTFARGTLARLPDLDLLFVSGTASIVGHQTVHPGDVAGQVRESLANIAAVLGEANRAAGAVGGVGQAFTLAALDYRVYLRHAGDFDAVRAALLPLVGERAAVVYVQADICRADLLVEIEALAMHPRTAAA
ncbi:MAG TPA: Rid family hydrolase [Azospira sp.]|nr:Rid family hydrolase [Azospira sp.]